MSNLSAASYRRTLDDCLRQTFQAERQYQNARYHYRVVLNGGSTEALARASDVLSQAEGERNYTIGIAEFAHKCLIEAEIAEAAEQVVAHSLETEFCSNVLPFVIDAWQG